MPRGDGMQPIPWTVSFGSISPEWRWAWKDLVACVPMWSGVGANSTGPREVLTGATAVLNEAGIGYDGSSVTVKGRSLLKTGPTNNDKSWFHFPGMNDKFQNIDTQISFFTAVVPQEVSQGNPQRIVHWTGDDNGNTAGTFLGYTANTNRLAFRIQVAATDVTIEGANNSAPFDVFTTAAGTYDDPDMSLYQDGALIATGSQAGPLVATVNIDHLVIGESPEGINNRTFGGHILVAYVWARTLSASEVMRLHLDPFGPIRRAPIARRFSPAVAVSDGALSAHIIRQAASRRLRM